MEPKDEHSLIPQELLLAMQPLLSTVVTYSMLHAYVARCCVNLSSDVMLTSNTKHKRLDEDQIVSITKLMVDWSLKKTTEASLKQVTASSPGRSEYAAFERSTPRGTTVLIGVAADTDGWSNKVSRAKKLAYDGDPVVIKRHNDRVSCRRRHKKPRAQEAPASAAEVEPITTLVVAPNVQYLLQQRVALAAQIADINMQIFLAPEQLVTAPTIRLLRRDGTPGAAITRLSSPLNALFLEVMSNCATIYCKHKTPRNTNEKRELLTAHPSSFQTQLGTQSASAGQGNSEGAVLYASGVYDHCPPTLETINVKAFVLQLHERGFLMPNTTLRTSFVTKVKPSTRDHPDTHAELCRLRPIFELALARRISTSPLVEEEVTLTPAHAPLACRASG
jgi:hypothetical protein